MLMNRLTREHLAGDLVGGLTAGVVALPLALAFGVASGAGAIAGLYGAAWTGLMASLFGGTRPQVSGPTGPMTVVAATVFTHYAGEPSIAFTIFALGGLFQILFGMAKLGRYINLMPYPVVSGFMTGIGGIIIIIQLAPILGHSSPPGILNDLRELPGYLTAVNTHALILSALSLALVYGVRGRIARYLPPTLLALIVGTLVGRFWLTDAPVIGDIPSGWPTLIMPRLQLDGLTQAVLSAIVLAVLGSIDSLLTSVVVDNVTEGQHDSDRELRGQGIGNLVAGLMGAIPGAGATMRTIANVRAGGRTELSGVIHALLIFAVVLGLGPLAAMIPLAVLAGILVKVGVDIVDWAYLRRLRTAPMEGVVLMMAVALLTIFDDLITAVAAGVVMASLLFVKRMADLQIEGVRHVHDEDPHTLTEAERDALKRCGSRLLYVHLSGPLSFGVANGMVRKIGALRKAQVLLLDLTDVSMVDSSATLAIEQIIRGAQRDGIHVILVGLSTHVLRVFGKLGILKLLKETERLPDRMAALEHAAELIGSAEELAVATP